MKGPLLLPLLLLGTVAAFYLENSARSLDSHETQMGLSQSLEGSGEQGGDSALTDEVIQSEGEEAIASGCDVTSEDEGAMDSNLAGPDDDFQCPKEEDTIPLPSYPGYKTCNFRLIRQAKQFQHAQSTCRKCYQGNLVSIHNGKFNYRILVLVRGVNIEWVWIGGTMKSWLIFKSYQWTDGSRWNFQYWAGGQPVHGYGHCVTLNGKGGRWWRTSCLRRLPFVCSY